MAEEIKNRSKCMSSKELLYSEHIHTTGAEHVVNLLKNRNQTKPEMLFKTSSALTRGRGLLSSLEQSQNDLCQKSPEEYDIETVEDGGPFIEMDVAVINQLNADNEINGVSANDSKDFGSSGSESSNLSDTEHELELSETDEEFAFSESLPISKFPDTEYQNVGNDGYNIANGKHENVIKGKRKLITVIEDELEDSCQEQSLKIHREK